VKLLYCSGDPLVTTRGSPEDHQRISSGFKQQAVIQKTPTTDTKNRGKAKTQRKRY
jgi:hypothetical protein